MNPGWHLTFTGWPWWLLLPVAGAAVWALLRFQARELATLPAAVRPKFRWLRGTALGVLLLFLLEPALSRRTTERVLPLVGVLVDRSGSMAVTDEAIAGKSVSRYDRALRLAEGQVLPVLNGKARVRVFSMDTAVAPLDPAKPEKLLPNRATDFAASLSALSKVWAQDYVGGVVLLSDGRQTAGVDPLPVIRSLHARGGQVAGVLVGSPSAPPDAVLAEVSGASEVFPGEDIPLTARYRITGATNLGWDLVLSHDGKEVERRTLVGTERWQYETFTVASTNLGLNRYQARLELAREPLGAALLDPRPLTLELWRNLPGGLIAEMRGGPSRKPNETASLDRLAYGGRGENYGARIRGFLLPPQSGPYRFGISSDDSSELWLSPSENPAEKSKICEVVGFVPNGKWDEQRSQKSRPITLKARQPYYFEILHKQGGGEDHLAVDWLLPDDTRERPIRGLRLAPFAPDALAQIARKRTETQKQTNEWHEASLANNSAEKSLAVTKDPIKVLLVDSTPRWESRYLAALFERDRRVSFTRRYHSVLIDDRTARFLPQNQAEWDSFDMVVLGDLDSNELPQEQQLFLANFVARRGGFLVCVAGPRAMPKAFSLGTMANLLPVRVALPSGRETDPVTAVLTAEGLTHPVMQVLNESAYNQQLWPLLPPLQWIADSTVAKPGAAVLLTAQNPVRTPLVAVQRYGAGRVFWMGTEESWRWRDRIAERVHQTFWLQVMRWGLAGRLHGSQPELQVGLDSSLLAPGETAELKARVATRKGEPIAQPPQVTLERVDENGQTTAASAKTVPMVAMREAPGLWQLTLAGLEEGTWRVTTTHDHPDLQGYSETRELSVRDRNNAEELELAGDLSGLNRLAAAGGLRAVRSDECDALMKEFTATLKPRNQERLQTLRLWNNYVSMTIVMALLCAEWVLRKRHGLA